MGVAVRFERGDTVSKFIRRTVFSFATHFALQARQTVVQVSNRSSAALVIFLATLLIYFVESELERASKEGVEELVQMVLFVLEIVQLALSFLFVSVADIILNDALGGAVLTFETLWRPLTLLFHLVAFITLYKHFFESKPASKAE